MPDGARSELILVRHGQTAWHAENRYAGVSDVDLTNAGRAQARTLADWAIANPPDLLFTSPVRRALETVAPVETALGLRAMVVDELREVHFGVAEGRTIGELAQTDPGMVERFHRDPAINPFPGAESAATAADRGVLAIKKIAAAAAGRCALVVAHNTLIRLTLCALLGVRLDAYRTVFPRLDNATLTHISVAADGSEGTALLSFNVPI